MAVGMCGGRPPERGAGIGGIGAQPVPGLGASLGGIWGAASLVYLMSSTRPPTPPMPPTPMSLGALGGLGYPPCSMLGGGVEYWPRHPGEGRPGEGRDGAGEW